MRKFKVTFYEDSHSRNKLSEIVEAIDYDEAENKVLAMYDDDLIFDEIHDVFDTSLNDKRIYIDMPDGLTYAIPVMVIAEHKACDMARKFDDVFFYQAMLEVIKSFEARNGDYQIVRWAKTAMRWQDVKNHAVILKRKTEINYDKCWRDKPFDIK